MEKQSLVFFVFIGLFQQIFSSSSSFLKLSDNWCIKSPNITFLEPSGDQAKQDSPSCILPNKIGLRLDTLEKQIEKELKDTLIVQNIEEDPKHKIHGDISLSHKKDPQSNQKLDQFARDLNIRTKRCGSSCRKGVTEAANDTCISGHIEILEKNKGILKLKDLKPGDLIPGYKTIEDLNTKSWCKILYFVKSDQKVEYFGNFTQGHYIVTKDAQNTPKIVPYSPKDLENNRQYDHVYNLISDCHIIQSQNEELITPFAQNFCNIEMTFEDFSILYKLVKGLTEKSGMFFDPQMFLKRDVPIDVDLNSLMCRQFLNCVKYDAQCLEMKSTFKELVYAYAKEQFRDLIVNYFPISDINILKQ